MQPIEIRVSADRASLEIEWEDGRTQRLSARWLRANCRSARSQRRRLEGQAGPPPEDLAIADVQPVGVYAVNIVFSDGHDRGIYPWTCLRELAEAPDAAAPQFLDRQAAAGGGTLAPGNATDEG